MSDDDEEPVRQPVAPAVDVDVKEQRIAPALARDVDFGSLADRLWKRAAIEQLAINVEERRASGQTPWVFSMGPLLSRSEADFLRGLSTFTNSGPPDVADVAAEGGFRFHSDEHESALTGDKSSLYMANDPGVVIFELTRVTAGTNKVPSRAPKVDKSSAILRHLRIRRIKLETLELSVSLEERGGTA